LIRLISVRWQNTTIVTPVRCLVTIILVLSFISCSTPLILKPFDQDNKLEDNSQPIKIFLTNNRTIMFESRQYTIHENLDSSYIRGVGTQVVETGGGNTHFEGSISIREIKDIEVLEFSNITPIVIGAFVAIIVIGSVYMFFLRYDIK